MKYIILDLEATCWDSGPKRINEIIEIGAVCINAQQKPEDEFNAFVRPVLNPQLSEFCTELTSITQADVDKAETFDRVIKRFREWIGFDTEYWLCSWGFYDRKQLEQDCRMHKMGIEWLRNHISLKHQHAKIKQLSRPMGMSGALHIEGLPLIGTHHRGIDDARNISAIFMKHFHEWEYK